MNLLIIKQLLFAVSFLTVSAGKCYAQSNELKIPNLNVVTGIDYEHQAYYVLSGDESFYRKKFDSNNWEQINYLDSQLPKTNDFPYQFFHVKKKNFLVHNGCGEVYEFRNDSIIRIDNSFQHKNQFYASSFVYKDEIYFFGGYGLFTFKNILTKFDFSTQEWELVKYKDYSNLPSPRNKATSFVKNNELIIISGNTVSVEEGKLTNFTQQLFDVWTLNLDTKIWNYEGDIANKDLFKSRRNPSNSYVVGEQLISDNDRLFNINIENNTLEFFTSGTKFYYSSHEKYNSQNGEIIYAIQGSDVSATNYYIIVEAFQTYSGNIIETAKFLKSQPPIFLYFGILLFLILVFFLGKRLITPKFKKTIYSKNGDFYYQNRLINNFTEEEKILLQFLYDHKAKPTPVVELVDIFTNGNDTNYNSLTKKKDLILNNLKQKLAFILEIDEEQLFLYTKDSRDKRIKLLQLNGVYFK